MNKKLFLISAIACCCSLSSCDMDLTPETNIATDESVRNVGDAYRQRPIISNLVYLYG